MGSEVDARLDAMRIKEIVNDIRFEEILRYLRSAPLLPQESRLQVTLKHFLAVGDARKKPVDSEHQIALDCISLQSVISSATSVNIKNLLSILGNIPNRREVAAKLLLNGAKIDAPKENKLESFPHLNGVHHQPSSTIVRPARLNLISNDQKMDCDRGYIPISTSAGTITPSAQLEVQVSLVDSIGASSAQPTCTFVEASASVVTTNAQPQVQLSLAGRIGAPSAQPTCTVVRESQINSTSYDENGPNEGLTDISDKVNNLSTASTSLVNPNTIAIDQNAPSTSDTTSGVRFWVPHNTDPDMVVGKRTLLNADAPQFFPNKRVCKHSCTKSNSEKDAVIDQLVHFLQDGAPESNQEFQPVLREQKKKINDEQEKCYNFLDECQKRLQQDNLDWNSAFNEPKNLVKSKENDYHIGPFLNNNSKENREVPGPAEPKQDIEFFGQMQEKVPQGNPEVHPELKEEIESVDLLGENNRDAPESDKATEEDNFDNKALYSLMEMFPQACPQYLRQLARRHSLNVNNMDDVVAIILSEDYPKRPEKAPSPENEADPEEILNMLKDVLPEADPTYLEQQADRLSTDKQALEMFINDALVYKQYPTKKEYLRKQQLSAQQRQYSTEFKVERFVDLFPDPQAVFEDPNRKSTIRTPSDLYYVTCVMKNKFSELYAKDIQFVVNSMSHSNIGAILTALASFESKGRMKKKRCANVPRPDSGNIPMLQELAYFENKESILKYIQSKKEEAARARQNAKELNLLQTCGCCCDDEIMPNDILTCTGGCSFCCECIRKSVEIAFGEGKINFPCLGECDKEFSLQVLQKVLPPKIFSKLAQKKALAEVKAAGIEDLVGCPFCDFATIVAPEDKLFRCLNPDCMKESCRLCKEPSHVPLRCEEVEKDEAVKARTYIENKMTEALIRECWKCGKKFIKVEGCNKMTCTCGAMMCYICRKPVKNYAHFNGQGGDKYHLCPLFSDNFSVNESNVLKAAEQAKKEVDPAQLKYDPTADLNKHFERRKKPKVSAANIQEIEAHLANARRELRQIAQAQLGNRVMHQHRRH